MADVSVYKRCTVTYHTTTGVVRAGEVRLASDPTVSANPAFWVTLTDAEMSSGKRGFHDN